MKSKDIFDIAISIGTIIFSIGLGVLAVAMSIGLPILCVIGLLKYLGVI